MMLTSVTSLSTVVTMPLTCITMLIDSRCNVTDTHYNVNRPVVQKKRFGMIRMRMAVSIARTLSEYPGQFADMG